jgi:beta-hydroxylase
MIQFDKTPGWYNSSDFYFNRIIESNFEEIRTECMQLFESGEFIPHQQSKENVYETHKLANKWDVFDLRNGNNWIEEQCNKAPYTSTLLKSFLEIQNYKYGKVYFSVISGNSDVLRHKAMGLTSRTRHQLCIETPPNVGIDDLHLEVNQEIRAWEQGKIITFDDTFMHSVKNNTPHTRIVLIYDSTNN